MCKRRMKVRIKDLLSVDSEMPPAEDKVGILVLSRVDDDHVVEVILGDREGVLEVLTLTPSRGEPVIISIVGHHAVDRIELTNRGG